MFLNLRIPDCDKGVSIFVDNLAGDGKNYSPWGSEPDWDSDRSRADRAIEGANRALGDGRSNAFFMLFHQFNWAGTTGYEYWSKDYELIAKHVLLVARALDVPLHVHDNVALAMFMAAEAHQIKFDFEQIGDGKYFVMTDVVVPDGLLPPFELFN